jgi:DNA-directed RNA polymerase subunit alpha
MNEIHARDFFLGCKECVLENPRSFYGSFTLGPFQNSQSLTIANALRRTLLTEIQNIAITHVEIDGVFHEYSLLDGVRESVLDILLNFKDIVLKTSLPFEKPLFGYLNVRGPGIIRASDLKLPPNVSCVDPDQYIATLSENGKLSLKFTVSDFCLFSKAMEIDEKKGKSFSFQKVEKSSQKQNFFKNSNPLSVDPNFNAILKVSYLLENLEPGLQSSPVRRNSETSLIHLEIWTNGSIHPRKAFYLTFDFLNTLLSKFEEMKSINKKYESCFFDSEEIFVKILKSYESDFRFYESLSFEKLFSSHQKETALQAASLTGTPLRFSKTRAGTDFPNTTEHEVSNQSKYFSGGLHKRENENRFFVSGMGETAEEKNLELSIKNLNFPLRIHSSLVQNKIFTLGDLLNLSTQELCNFSGIGNFSLGLIQKKLKKMGFFLKKE